MGRCYFFYLRLCLLLLLNFILEGQGSHVMFLHLLASYSHRVALSPLAEKLVSRGHKVTYIAPTELKRSNLTDMIPKRLKAYMDDKIEDFDIQYRLNNSMPSFHSFELIQTEACQELLLSEDFKLWINNSPNVDLIIVDNFPDCALGLGHKLQAKIIVFLPVVLFHRHIDNFAIPDESYAIPMPNDQHQSVPLNFWQRFQNCFLVIGYYFHSLYNSYSSYQVIQRNLDLRDLPALRDLYENVSLVLTNAHSLDEHPRSLPPMFVSVPGMHIKETTEPLNETIEQFITERSPVGGLNEGFVYISLGTMVKPENMPQQIIEMFLEAIAALPQFKFLWKWSGELPNEKKMKIPENLKFYKWFEQQDVLAHPKIRAFITQAGRPSTQEAMYYAVPRIIFPILGDQDYNANRGTELGISIRHEIGHTTPEQLQMSIREITGPDYKRRCQEVSKLFKDLPMKPIDTAVWWTEYVLRHDDLSHLKPSGRNLTWYQRRQLDVWAVFVFGVVALICSIKTITGFFTQRRATHQNKIKSS